MKEMTSNHDDVEKRLAIFFGLGAFLMSALVGLLRGYTLEGFLLQGIVVMIIASLAAYGFGVWLKSVLKKGEDEDTPPANVERRSTNAEDLEKGSVVTPAQMGETVINEDPASPSGQVVNYTLPELVPDMEETPAEGEAELPPPPVPAWLK